MQWIVWLIVIGLVLVTTASVLFLSDTGGITLAPALCMIGAAFIVLALALAGISQALARDVDGRYANSPLKGWFDSLHSGKGPCCSDADGTVVTNADWESKDGHYRVRITEEWIRQHYGISSFKSDWYDVPEEAVITEPNLFGQTMVWPMLYPSGVVIRCFIVGSLS